ncbi:hypothetical protein VST7929_00082 [Vibrio stylophorae]|uniref:WG repeat-containing protein n=1 Tax=Vibrio stylophorae TaxID=659351 RepID=A0ABN8DR66_9VIBR|nr:hypothetical protein [Vibrio stylophorae]CAH0532270.1 hypothetical protein VST7929_00082 [Vibrio stylophorae]
MKNRCYLLALLPVVALATQSPDPYLITTKAISKTEFDGYIAQTKQQKPHQLQLILNEQKAYQMIGSRMAVVYDNQYEQNNPMRSLTLFDAKGQQIYHNEQMFECGFDAYLPQLDVLALICGHESDYILDLKTGQQLDYNPRYLRYAPNGQWRIATWENGQYTEFALHRQLEGVWQSVNYRNAKGKYQCMAAPTTDDSGESTHCAGMGLTQWVSNDAWVFYDWVSDGYFYSQLSEK